MRADVVDRDRSIAGTIWPALLVVAALTISLASAQDAGHIPEGAPRSVATADGVSAEPNEALRIPLGRTLLDAPDSVIGLHLADAAGRILFPIASDLAPGGVLNWTVPWNLPTGDYRIAGRAGGSDGQATSPAIALSVSSPEKSPVETHLNPLGDPWSLRVPNPDIPIVTSFSCFRRLPERFARPAPQQLDFAATFASKIVFGECSPVMAQPDALPANLKAPLLLRTVAEIKASDPSVRYLGYQAIAQFSTGMPGFGDIFDNHQDWFLHKAGAPHELLKNKRGGRILDVTNRDYQRYIAEKIGAALDDFDYDGFLADGVAPTLIHVEDPNEIPEPARSSWGRGWLELLAEVKRTIGGSKLLIANVSENHEELIVSLLDHIDGVMFEDPFGPLRLDLEDSGIRARFERLFHAAASRDKYVINVVNTNVNSTDLATTDPEQEKRFARYYLSAYLIFADHPKHLLQYYTPSAMGPQFESQAFFTDWNLRVGRPRARYEAVRPRVYRRSYENAIVYLNNSAEPFEVEFGACCSLLTPEGRRVERHTMPPASGMLFMGAKVLQEIASGG